MQEQVDVTGLERLCRKLPPVIRDSAADYLVAGRLTHLVRLGDRLGGRVRGHNGSYHVAVRLAESPEFACDCGRDQPCRHAVALALAFLRAPNTFTDLSPALDSWQGDAAGSALRHVVERCFGPNACDSADALLELTGMPADADPLRLETYLETVAGLAVLDRDRAIRLMEELRGRALLLAERQGRTAAARALVALIAAGARLLGRPGWAAERGIADEVIAAVRSLDSLLVRGGLDAELLASSLTSLGEVLPLLPCELIGPVMDAASRISGHAAAFLTYRLRAACELAKADQAVSPSDAALRERVRELVMAEVQFLLSHGSDDEALAVARFEARGPAGVMPLIDALAGSGRREEAIATGRDALSRATASEVPAIRRRLASLLGQVGQPELATAYLAANYNEHPDPAGFAELREFAGQCGSWNQLCPGALARLRVSTGLVEYAQAVVDEARALLDNSADQARGLLINALGDLPLCPAGESARDWRRGFDTLLREARRQFRLAGDEPGWHSLREECRRRYGI